MVGLGSRLFRCMCSGVQVLLSLTGRGNPDSDGLRGVTYSQVPRYLSIKDSSVIALVQTLFRCQALQVISPACQLLTHDLELGSF